MSTTSVIDAFKHFEREPSLESYLTVRGELYELPEFHPHSVELDAAIRSDDPIFVVGTITVNLFPNLLISPFAYELRGRALLGLDKSVAANQDFDIAFDLREAIQETGDGSKSDPYLVARIDDEYDMIDDKRISTDLQMLKEIDSKSYDVHKISGGGEIWFDITDALNKSEESNGFNIEDLLM